MATSKPAPGWWIQVGADPSAASLLEAARARGLETLVFDPDANAPGARFATRLMTRPADATGAILEDLRALARSETIAGCHTTSTSPAALRTVAALREAHGSPGPGPERTALLLTRSAWKKRLADAEIATPAVAILDTPQELDRLLGVHPSLLIKPATGGGGSEGVSRVRVGDPRNRELFDEARLASDSDLVRAEEFVAGEAYSIDGCVREARFELLHLGRAFSMRHLRGTLPTGTAWGSPGQGRRADEDPRWGTSTELGQRITDALGLDATFLHIDVLDDGEQDHVIDVRLHLGLAIDRALTFSGTDVSRLALDLVLGASGHPETSPAAVTRGFAQRFFYATAQGRIEPPPPPVPSSGADSARPTASGWRSVPLAGDGVRLEWDRAIGDPVERPRSSRDRVARALVEADDRNAAWMRANELDPDAVFRVREPREHPVGRSRSPLWPITPEPH